MAKAKSEPKSTVNPAEDTSKHNVPDAGVPSVEDVDKTAIAPEDVNGSTILEKTTENDVAKSNRAVAELGRGSEPREDGEGYSERG